tara:strand:- start:360 stop:539 length:180 start_codon:yes stop_codon:yes gene_type:complete
MLLMIKLSDFQNTDIEYSSNNNINSEIKETAEYLYIIIEKDKETADILNTFNISNYTDE